MTILRDILQKHINELQELLNQYQDDDALIQAVMKKWDINHPCRKLVFSCRDEAMRLAADKSRGATGKERKNVPISKQPTDE